MTVHNSEIAELFTRLADLLEIEEANPFRVRAYRNVARLIASLPRSIAESIAAGEDLTRLPGVGEDLAGKIETIVRTGRLPLLDEVASRTPEALRELMGLPGLGPKRVKLLYKALGIRSFDDLRTALEAGRVRELPGFGSKIEERLRSELNRLTGTAARLKLAVAEEIAQALLAYLRSLEGVLAADIAGSFRRRRETVGDLDVVITARRGTPVGEHFLRYPEIAEVLAHGGTRVAARLRPGGVQVDVRIVPQVSYGAALHYFTGSKAHNIAVRTLGVRRGLKINEYGIFKGARRIGGRTETEVYAHVGLSYIEPELREDRGEIEAAREGRLPHLVRVEDLRGDLHCHTRATDGRDNLEALALAARSRGYDYLAITDHTQQVSVARGMDAKRVLKQIREIDQLNARLDGITLLKAMEVDILKDGALDLPDEVLAQLDLTVCAVHSHFNLPLEEQTARILRAMENHHFHILAHPSGRLINEREPYALDMERVIAGAQRYGCFLELNAQPDRLDLTDLHCRMAKEAKVLIAISTDAHSAAQLAYLRHGVDQARRAWLEPADVLNTRALSDLRALISART